MRNTPLRAQLIMYLFQTFQIFSFLFEHNSFFSKSISRFVPECPWSREKEAPSTAVDVLRELTKDSGVFYRFNDHLSCLELAHADTHLVGLSEDTACFVQLSFSPARGRLLENVGGTFLNSFELVGNRRPFTKCSKCEHQEGNITLASCSDFFSPGEERRYFLRNFFQERT